MRKWIHPDRAAECAVVIGHSGENGAAQIVFDLSDWIGEYGDGGYAALFLCRPTEKTAYPILLDREDENAVWTVSAADTAIAGIGKAELRYSVGDTLVKSGVWRVKVLPSVTEGDPPDDPFEDLLGRMADYAAEAAENAGKVLGLTASAESVGEDEDAGVEVTDGETLCLHFSLPRGAKGDKGDKGDTGASGAAFTYEQFTPAQLASLRGEKGDDGYTPVRGTDYWTAADIAAIRGYVDDAILNGSW